MLGSGIEKKKKELYDKTEDLSDNLFSYDEIENLPEPVQRYFRNVLEEGQSYISNAELEHVGKFKTEKGQKWLDIKGKVFFTTHKPGFIWVGKVKPFLGIPVTASDSYIGEKGEMKVKLLSLFTLSEESGEKMDQADLARWVLEAPWYPTALLPRENLEWESIDSSSAKLYFEDGDHTIEASFVFNEVGEITESVTERYWGGDENYKLVEWGGKYDDYRRINGVKVPTNIEVAWHFDSGVHKYANFVVSDLNYNTIGKK